MRAEKGELDIFADPADKKPREKTHRRRNSESSVREKPTMDPEEEKKRRERKYRESKKSGKQQKRLDVIDKLDVTSIYGTGLFHHDGPFDACNPHRNRKGSRKAPMHAFPEDSLNMRLGGAGPLKKNIDIDQFHGRHAEGYNDYNEAAIAEGDAEPVARPLPARTTSFNPTARDIVHGAESAGLGTSTFLDGAPASRKAIEEGEKEAFEQQQQLQQQQQLSRKKSLAQRFRANRSNTLEGKIPGRRVQSPDGTPITPLESAKSDNGNNPFFQNYDQEYEKKGAAIAFAEAEQKPGRARAPSSPRRDLPNPLERSRTADSAAMQDERKSSTEAKPSGGFLSRMKSLKAKKPRPERRETSG
ncbi:uncharacterized protein HMPREF1541_09330 [Cyphellophora europaea CBS 101466]|uniref:Pal1 cell morphology protein n=1 Tax=Cyphellophora europaea (strain CBS 101466) TaxID=1220924 RepID=W2SBV7_CYPE1|nr:uncharacterized protein HMPREF1541_09330 [Cyphellophora europaea CBS 101466]ETN45498.1 hypothetical protein HMPREF1541_09330 [Cyphellophora europaea CBS 101466]